MYSPRSVSTTTSPPASIARSSADSSLTIDFDLMILLTPWRRSMSSTWRLTSSGVSAQSTVAPRAVALRSKISSQTSRLSSARWRIARAASRVASKSSSSVSESRRWAMNLPLIFCRLPCSCALPRLACARSLKCIEAICMAFRSVRVVRAGQHLGDVQHARLRVPAAAQPALDVEHAAEIAEDDGIRAARGNMLALVVRESGRNLAELDGKGAAEAAAGLAFGHFGELESAYPLEQRARLSLDPHFAQAGAAVVVGNGRRQRPGHRVELEHVDQEVGQFVGL